MPKKKPRKVRTQSQKEEEDFQELQNPKTMEEEEGSQQLQNPETMEEEEGSQQLQNPETVEEEDSQQILQNPKTMEEEEASQQLLQNPKMVEEEDSQQLLQNPKTMEEEESLQVLQNPKTMEEEPSQPSENQQPEDQNDRDQEMQDVEKQPEERHQEEEGGGGGELQLQSQQEPEEEEQPHPNQDEEEAEGMALSPTLPPPPPVDEISLPGLIMENPINAAPNVSRKPSKRKKPLNQKQRATRDKKIQILREKLQPIPFVPSKTLDFLKHEKLLKRLGLWDFAHLEFDRDIRTDLLAQLIANFTPQSRGSYVNDFRVMVNRADLGRALKLPVKKDKINPSEASDSDVEVLSEDTVSFVEDFVSNWVILHEDAWILPEEILGWNRHIKEGQPQKVDWPGFIWFMVEKELMQGAELKSCYYASHLQCLMKYQHEDLFNEEPEAEVYIKEEEVYMKEEDDVVDMKTSILEDFQGQDLEEERIELSLGQEKIEYEQIKDEDVMDFQECKEEEPGDWRLDGRNNVGEHFLQPCNLNEGGVMEFQLGRKEKEEEQEPEPEPEPEDEDEDEDEGERYNLSLKSAPLERLSSTDLIQAMATTNVHYSSSVNLFDHSSEELLGARVDTDLNPGGSSMFGNACKRELSHEDDARHHSFNDNHKRLRIDGQWETKASDFDVCMEQVQSWMGKARMLYEAKEQAYANYHVNERFLYSELQQRNNLIEALQKAKIEEQQKRHLEIYRLEHELYLMNNLLNGYKKALKETRRAFSEYRGRYPQPDEPLYKDVSGPGGVVLSTMELEKQRLEREEEDRVKRFLLEEQIKGFELGWSDKLEEHLNKVQLMDGRLLDFENEVKLLKEMFLKRKSES